MSEKNQPPIQSTSPNKEQYNNVTIDDTPSKKNIENKSADSKPQVDRNKIVKDLVKLAIRKSPTHQLKNEELHKCGVSADQCDKVRDAISKADAFRNNFFFSSIASVVGVLAGFVDTIIKVVLVTCIFLLTIQVPYINSQANKHLTDYVSEAEFNYQKYQITLEQFSDILAKYKIKGAKAEQEIPAQIKEDSERSKRWMQYKGKNVETIWKEVAKKPFKSRDKIDDLYVLYKKTFKYYSPGFPTKGEDYKNAAIIALAILLGYMFIQSVFGISTKSYLRYITLKNEIKKVV